MRIALLLLLLVALLPATALALKVRDGDLLFVTAARTGLSGAIDNATATQGQLSFDHVALVAHAGDAAVVLRWCCTPTNTARANNHWQHSLLKQTRSSGRLSCIGSPPRIAQPFPTPSRKRGACWASRTTTPTCRTTTVTTARTSSSAPSACITYLPCNR
ncbi:exported hypothetical protein [Xanthomonas citri pv. fuscans]|nr:exported hypothetical protein [Xanthomonas citri pv. fuscans]SOO01542.1 exported hypothetical protein [Xanthomonas citri pv. fuscans]SOO03784.1 exported hypothetical protein [Xanthomonas citri pv. fuscans]SOO10106.1 exported hypothetical protein [Xanthomonas citri pv. fuscans]SOO14084.1 exported hypothetical protein [Xanthomonas citri pv. fuscans]